MEWQGSPLGPAHIREPSGGRPRQSSRRRSGRAATPAPGLKAGTQAAERLAESASLRQEKHQHGADRDRSALPRRVKLLIPPAIAQTHGACGSSAVGPFRRLTVRLPGPKLCLSPQPHGVRHELRPPARATPARHPGRLAQSPTTRNHRVPPHRKLDPQRKTRQEPNSPRRRSASPAGRQRQSPRP
jgi:hypothetical protein